MARIGAERVESNMYVCGGEGSRNPTVHGENEFLCGSTRGAVSRSSEQRPGSAVAHAWGSSELRPSAQAPLISQHTRNIAQEEERCTVRSLWSGGLRHFETAVQNRRFCSVFRDDEGSSHTLWDTENSRHANRPRVLVFTKTISKTAKPDVLPQ